MRAPVLVVLNSPQFNVRFVNIYPIVKKHVPFINNYGYRKKISIVKVISCFSTSSGTDGLNFCMSSLMGKVLMKSVP